MAVKKRNDKHPKRKMVGREVEVILQPSARLGKIRHVAKSPKKQKAPMRRQVAPSDGTPVAGPSVVLHDQREDDTVMYEFDDAFGVENGPPLQSHKSRKGGKACT